MSYDRLYDVELNHQHKKEIQQYISNVDSTYNKRRLGEKTSSIQSAFQQTVSALHAAKDGIVRAVATKTLEPTHGALEDQPVSRGLLAEFGLDSTHTDWEYDSQKNDTSSSMPLLSYGNEPIPGNHKDDNFFMLNKFRMAPKNEGWGAVSDFDQFFTVSSVFFS